MQFKGATMSLEVKEWVSFEGGYIDFEGNHIPTNMYFEHKDTGEIVQMDNDLEEVWDCSDESIDWDDAWHFFRQHVGGIERTTNKAFWEQQK
jgi:alpha/beta superfamily hydrolase